MDTDMNPSDDLATHLPPLLEAAGITNVQIDILTKRESFKGAEVSTRAQEVTGPAREEHRRRGFGFWEYVLSATYDIDANTRRALIDGALRHNSSETIQTQLSLSEFNRSLSAQAFRGLPERTIISLTSHVETSAGRSWHLPMLDMGAPVGAAGAAACVDALNSLGISGQLYESGRSYHFIADRPVSPDNFRVVLSRAQLLSPIVDARWIAHQLIDGRAGLRISTDTARHAVPHKFVTLIDGEKV
jgi:hypothetical protein